jgi:glycosyltransferase involved in cell wall biosynthesis
MNNKVLIATYYWPPSGGSGVQRFLKFCKYLPDFGVDPTVLTVANPTYPIIDQSLSEEVPEGIKVFKTKSYEPFSLYAKLAGSDTDAASNPTQALNSDDWKSKIATWIRANVFIPDARFGWLFTARKKAVEIVKKEDINAVITTGPPHSTHFIGKYVRRHCEVQWIADFRDPWSDVYYNQLLPRTELMKSADRNLELSVLKNADQVSVVSPSMVEIQEDIYPRSYSLITNGFDPDDFDNTSEELAAYDYESFTIRFVGSVREAAIPDGIFAALSRLPDELDICLEFIGNVHPRVLTLIKEYGIEDRVTIQSYKPHKDAVKAMQAADLLLLSISKTENSELIITGKLFDYLGAQTPILFIGTTKGDAASIIKETQQGVCFEHSDFAGIQNYLRQVVEDPDQLPEMGLDSDMRGHPYSRISLTKKLADLLK